MGGYLMRRAILCLFVSGVIFGGAAAWASTRYVGIGLTIQQDATGFMIVKLIPGAPADRGGVHVGDALRGVDGRVLTGWTLDQVALALRGNNQVGTPVTLTLLSPGDSGTHDLTLYRDVVEIDCFMEGSANLTYSGTPQMGWISGWIGDQSVHWNVGAGWVNGTYRNESISLQLGRDLTGWIHGVYVDWMGFQTGSGMTWNFYQSCIP